MKKLVVLMLLVTLACFGQVNGKFNKLDANGPVTVGGTMPTVKFTFTNLTPMVSSWTFDYSSPTTAIQSMLPGVTASGDGGITVTGSYNGAGTGLTGVGASFRAGLSTNLYSGNAYSFPYQTAPNSTFFLNGNTSTTPAFVTSTGTGSATQAPTLTSSTGSGSVVLSDSPALTGTPTAPTPTAGDNSTTLATTAFVNGALPAFTGTSGYQVLPSGLMMQWATGYACTADCSQTVPFPTTFTNGCLTVMTTNKTNSGTNIAKNWAVVGSCNTTGVTVELQRRGDDTINETPMILAIGW